MVYVDLDGGRPYFPESTGFLDWYERWLDELLAGCKIHWFGIGMPGLEPELADAPRRGERLVDGAWRCTAGRATSPGFEAA